MKHYKTLILNLFYSYLTNEISKKELVDKLYKIEIEMTEVNPYQELWFKFFNGDTLATTIANIDMDDRDENLYQEYMQIAIDNPNEFKIYVS